MDFECGQTPVLYSRTFVAYETYYGRRVEMRLAIPFIALLVVAPTVQAADGTALQDAVVNHVRQLAAEARCEHHCVVADSTVGGANRSFTEFIRYRFSPAVADELEAAYASENDDPRPLDLSDIGGIAVVPVAKFANGPVYDWPSLLREYPGTDAVLRFSAPVVDSLGSHAVVRYDIVSRSGDSRSKFVEFEKQRDGTWRPYFLRVGNLEMIFRESLHSVP